MTVAERHAARYRQPAPQPSQQSGYQQPGYPQSGYPAAAPAYGQAAPTRPGEYPAPRTSSGQHKRTFHEARPSPNGQLHSNLPLQSHGNQQMQPLPRPVGRPPYHLTLNEVLPPEDIAAIERSGRLLLHIAGDTGGVKAPESQQIVAMAMETQFNYPDPTARPAFFYHLGDVVYYFGQPQEYYPQFYDAYVHYPAPIFAIPGNHDGDMTDGSPPSLAAFVNNFCAAEPHVTKESGETARDAMTQPNVYWTLDAPFLNVIGLYSNVPEGGRIDNDQLAWFINELRTAPTNKALFLAVHHPAFSSDVHHSGSSYILKTLDYAFQQSGRTPDMIFTAHVHNYQRFTRQINGRHVPYIVAGAGGYWHLHYMAHAPDGSKLPIPYKMPDADIILENYCDDRHGFLRMMVTQTQVVGEYYGCSRPQESWRANPERLDSFALDLRTHKLVKGTDLR